MLWRLYAIAALSAVGQIVQRALGSSVVTAGMGKYAINPPPSWFASFSKTDCSESDQTSYCCWVASQFINSTWNDTSLARMMTVNTSCWTKTSGGSRGTLWLHLESTGMPNHPYTGRALVGEQGNSYHIRLQTSALDYDDDPAMQDICDSSILGMGAVGFATNGVPLYSPWSGEYVDAINPPDGYTEESFDQCAGHPDGSTSKVYHYHTAPECIGERGAAAYQCTSSSSWSNPIQTAVGNTNTYSSDDEATWGSTGYGYARRYPGQENYARRRSSCGSQAGDLCGCISGHGRGRIATNSSSDIVYGIALDGNLIYGTYNASGHSVSLIREC